MFIFGGNSTAVTGTSGDDVILGGRNIIVDGGAGQDIIFVGPVGDNGIFGGPGDDIIFGGRGSDVFAFRPGDGDDRIFGFESGRDSIYLNVSWDQVSVTEGHGWLEVTYGEGDHITVYGVSRPAPWDVVTADHHPFG